MMVTLSQSSVDNYFVVSQMCGLTLSRKIDICFFAVKLG